MRCSLIPRSWVRLLSRSSSCGVSLCQRSASSLRRHANSHRSLPRPSTEPPSLCRNGHLYVVHLLLKYNADPTLLDSQSFNTLHLAVHSSWALLLAYILFTFLPIAVDSCDTEGHTGLHWACYQGDAISVDLLLRAGADPRRADNAGLTPLHWAAVKGNAGCIKRIVQAGADLSAKEASGKTPRDMAAELKSLAPFKRGLVDAGYDEDGRKERRSLSPRNTLLAIFVLPTLAFALVLNTLAILPWWSGLLLASAEFFGMHHVISRILLEVRGPQHSDRITKSPYLCSIIVASMVWVSWVWLTRFARGALCSFRSPLERC